MLHFYFERKPSEATKHRVTTRDNEIGQHVAAHIAVAFVDCVARYLANPFEIFACQLRIAKDFSAVEPCLPKYDTLTIAVLHLQDLLRLLFETIHDICAFYLEFAQ